MNKIWVGCVLTSLFTLWLMHRRRYPLRSGWRKWATVAKGDRTAGGQRGGGNPGAERRKRQRRWSAPPHRLKPAYSLMIMAN